MIFRKISLTDGGFKGCSVEFYREKLVKDKPMQVLTKEYPKNPVHLGLEKMFKDLRSHLLEICGITDNSGDESITAHLISETSVDTIEVDAECIVIGGTKQVFEDKEIKLKTCKIQEEDGYSRYDELNELVNNICVETEEYLNGTKKVDDVEVAVRYVQAGKAKGITMDDLNAMDPQKMKDWAIKFLESGFGKVVLDTEDIVLDEEVQNSIQELQTEFNVPLEADAEAAVPVAEKKEKNGKKKIEATPVQTDEAEF